VFLVKISIITVCFNSAKTIRDTIESVLSQDYPEIEYIIIDGLSKDNTMNIVSEYNNKITKVISEPDRGIYDAMNKGIKLSTGDVIGILNSDDFFEYHAVISEVVNCFKSEPKASLVFGDVVFVEPNNTQNIMRFYSSEKFRSWKLRFGWMPPHPATFIKRSAYEQVGDYSIDYKISADYELFVRMLMVHKLAYARIDKVLVRMRAGGISTSGIKSSLLLNSEIVKACKINGVYTNLFFVLLKIPFKFLELLKKPTGVS
jgi:glycosyltransferase involved in cell wall biosynthesis